MEMEIEHRGARKCLKDGLDGKGLHTGLGWMDKIFVGPELGLDE